MSIRPRSSPRAPLNQTHMVEVLKAHFAGRLQNIRNKHALASKILLKELPGLGSAPRIALPFIPPQKMAYQPPPFGLSLPEPTIHHVFTPLQRDLRVRAENNFEVCEDQRKVKNLCEPQSKVKKNCKPLTKSLVINLRCEIQKIQSGVVAVKKKSSLDNLRILEQTARSLSSDSLAEPRATRMVLPRGASRPSADPFFSYTEKQSDYSEQIAPSCCCGTISVSNSPASKRKVSPLSALPDELLHLLSQYLDEKNMFRFAFACGRHLAQAWGVAAVFAHQRVLMLQSRCERQALLVSIALDAQKSAQGRWEDRVRERDQAVLAADAVTAVAAVTENEIPPQGDGTQGVRVLEALEGEQKALRIFQGSVGVLEIVMGEWGFRCTERDKALAANTGLKSAIRLVFWIEGEL